jgi:hypothetical protein
MERTLSLGVDYLGFLNSQLRNLRGYATLANELIQNADDAPDATEIVFDVREDALVVENNGYFADCGHIEERECPWLADPSKGHRCDFHRFRLTASGDKRREEGTTGAFGIGFIAVYQITERPELVSSGRHWVIRPERPDHERILVREPAPVISGTRFRLPWATDPTGGIRRDLGVEPVTPENVKQLLAELYRSLPSSLLFLRKLRRIQLKDGGRLVKEIEAIQEHDQIFVQETGEAGTKPSFWHLFRSDFGPEAERIRIGAPGQIEPKRRSDVVIAIPDVGVDHGGIQGLFHAYLPTQHQIGLPLHINADFYPSSDRKRILFEQGYQGEWNTAAVRAAARALGQALPDLPKLLGHKGLWRLINDIRDLARDAESGVKENALQSFWREFTGRVSSLPLVFTAKGSWQTTGRVRLLQNRDAEEPCLPILHELNLEIVHPDLAPYANILRDREVGVRYLVAADVAEGLRALGLVRSLRPETAPNWLRSNSGRDLLSQEIGLLLARSSSPQGLDACAIALSADGWLCPPSSLRRADEEAGLVFEPLGLPAVFAADNNPAAITDLILKFGVSDALDLLERCPADTLRTLWQSSPNVYLDLIDWFAERPADLRSVGRSVDRLRVLHIWPSGQELHQLDELVMPGGFEDPLQLANVIDARVTQKCGQFLKTELRARLLTLESYVTERVPEAFRSGKAGDAQVCGALNQILAENLGKLQDTVGAKDALAHCAIVECTDGLLRLPTVVYFDSDLVQAVLGAEVPLAQIPKERKEAVAALWSWLGVTKVPRPAEIIRRIEKTVAVPPTSVGRETVQQIFIRVGQQWDLEYRERHDDFARLRRMAWLPARVEPDKRSVGDPTKWYDPSRIYAVFQRYLFASQAPFLDIPDQQQRLSSTFMAFLGIPDTPEVNQVVQHLLQAARHKDFDLNLQVYRFLNDNAEDPKLAPLIGAPCLLIRGIDGGCGQFVDARKVFWGDHPFGRYRFRLNDDFRNYNKLLTRLGVKDAPQAADAVEVMTEISQEYGEAHKPLDEAAYSVVMQCWTALGRALEAEEIAAGELSALRERTIVPDDRKILNPPEWMYFEDRPGLKEKFLGFLDHNVIPRPDGAWRAMEAAGVRALSQAITTQLVECADPLPADDLQAKLKERSHLIARVLAAQKDANWRQELLSRLEVQSAKKLLLTYTVQAFRQTQTTKAEDAYAHFDGDPDIPTIFFVRDSTTPWSAIARELAQALNPAGEIGQIASGLKEVLRGDSPASVEKELSELGFAPLLALASLVVPESMSVAPGGTTTTTTTEPVTPYHPVAPTSESVGPPASTAPEIPVPAGGDGAGSGATRSARPGVEKPGTEVPTGVPVPHGAGSGQGHVPWPKKKRMKNQGRLGTYVYLVEETEDDGVKRSVDIEEITALDRAGVDRVLKDLTDAGFSPREMPHGHPGYDIESLDEFGTVARYVEVKSTSDRWGATGVGLSDTQFKEALEKGTLYWLYVVERAEDDDFEIHRIQDPANKVNLFVYDQGWREVAALNSLFEVKEGLSSQAHTNATGRRSILDLKDKLQPPSQGASGGNQELTEPAATESPASG